MSMRLPDIKLCLRQRLTEEINVSDVIGQDAYRRAVALSRRRTAFSQRGVSTDGNTASLHANGSHAGDLQDAATAKAAPWEP